MSGPTDSDYSRAIQALTIPQLWRAAGLSGQPPDRPDVVKSPFRDERTASFSLLPGLRNFKDHGSGDKGGLKEFAKLCWPGISEEDLRDKFVEIAGTKTYRPPVQGQPFVVGPDGVPQAAAPSPVDPALAKAAKAIAKKRQLAEQEERLYEERDALLIPKIEEKRRTLPAWPDFVRARYEEGTAELLADGKAMEKLAKARGWPYYWVEELCNLGKISYVLERGCDKGGRRERRQKAFAVEFPWILTDATGKASARLEPVGYHQRFFSPAQAPSGRYPQGLKETKGWLFVPSFPKFAPVSRFEEQIVECGRARGLAYDRERGVRDQFIAPLPFVLGELKNSHTVVLLEGQWDAISFYGACGWFHDTCAPSGVAVFGIRGAQGMDAFLGYWGRWLRANRPVVWVIADNDKAGRAWRETPPETHGKFTPPSLAEKLQHFGASKVVVSWLRPGAWGKDFNDYYRAAQPDPERMAKWMQKVGVMNAAGAFK